MIHFAFMKGFYCCKAIVTVSTGARFPGLLFTEAGVWPSSMTPR